MKQKPTFIYQVMHVLTWIAFIAMSIKAGAILTSYFIQVFTNPEIASKLYLDLNLSGLQIANPVYWNILVLSIAVISILQALLFYITLKIFQKLNFVSPFHEKIAQLIKNISILSFVIGLFINAVVASTRNIPVEQMPTTLQEYVGRGDSFIYFAGILYVIYLVFEKGIFLQQENDLTV